MKGERNPDEADFTGRTRWVYQELRDRKIALFLDKLPEGVWEIRYDLRAEVLQGALQIGNVLKVHPENEGECHAGAVAAIYGVDDRIIVRRCSLAFVHRLYARQHRHSITQRR